MENVETKKTIGEHYVDFVMRLIFLHEQVEEQMLSELVKHKDEKGKVVFSYFEEIPVSEIKFPELVDPNDTPSSD